MTLLFGFALLLAPPPAEDFYVARLRAGEDLLRAGRPADAVSDLRIAQFGLLDRPALFCESLSVRALAEEASGHADQATAVLDRLVRTRREVPDCEKASLDPAWRAEIDALMRRRLPASRVAAGPAAAPATAPPATVVPATAPRAATAAPSAPVSAPPETSRTEPTRPIPATPQAAPTPAPPPPPTRAVPPTALARVSPPAPTPVSSAVPEQELDRQPQIKGTTKPVYPARALQERVAGVVLLRVLVAKTGEPVRVEVARGIRQDLDEAALAAVRQWRFEPGQKGGAAVLSWTSVAVPFDLPRR